LKIINKGGRSSYFWYGEIWF